MTDKLIEQLKKLYPNIEKNQSELEMCSHLKQLQKDEILLDFHSVCRHYYFVNKGVLRIFFLEDGQEYTRATASKSY